MFGVTPPNFYNSLSAKHRNTISAKHINAANKTCILVINCLITSNLFLDLKKHCSKSLNELQMFADRYHFFTIGTTWILGAGHLCRTPAQRWEAQVRGYLGLLGGWPLRKIPFSFRNHRNPTHWTPKHQLTMKMTTSWPNNNLDKKAKKTRQSSGWTVVL